MKLIKINYKVVLTYVLIIPFSFYCAVTVPYVGLLTSFLGGIISLLLMFGSQQVFLLLKPMNKPFLWQMVRLLVLAFLIRLVLVWMMVMFDFQNTDNVIGNGYITQLVHADIVTKLILLVLLLIEMTGEELLLASVILPMLSYLKKWNYSWIFSVFIGSLLFSLMHLYAYDFNICFCVIAGLSHIPMIQAWKVTNSLRGGIYIHIFYNMIAPILVFGT